jgi:hypothetical protein
MPHLLGGHLGQHAMFGQLRTGGKLIDLLDSEDERIAIAAAISILDRVGLGKMKRSRLSVESMSMQLSPEHMVMIRETLELDG